QDFDLALTVNLDGCRHVLEACRSRPARRAGSSAGSRSGRRPRVVFASTLAAFGGSAMPETVTDRTKLTPQTTYGTTKAQCEHLGHRRRDAREPPARRGGPAARRDRGPAGPGDRADRPDVAALRVLGAGGRARSSARPRARRDRPRVHRRLRLAPFGGDPLRVS